MLLSPVAVENSSLGHVAMDSVFGSEVLIGILVMFSGFLGILEMFCTITLCCSKGNKLV